MTWKVTKPPQMKNQKKNIKNPKTIAPILAVVEMRLLFLCQGKYNQGRQQSVNILYRLDRLLPSTRIERSNKAVIDQDKLRYQIRLAKANNADLYYKNFAEYIGISEHSFYNFMRGSYELSQAKARMLYDVTIDLVEQQPTAVLQFF